MSAEEDGPAADEAPRVVVIIVAFNSGAHLQNALDALEAQSFRDFEIVLWDNASTDGAAAQARLPANAKRVTSETNFGFAGGNNRAARESAAPLIALLNPDAVPRSDWLERLVAAIDAVPGAVMAGSKQLRAEDESILDGLGDVLHVAGVNYRGGYGSPDPGREGIAEVFAPCGAAALYRRDAFEAADGFDESFFCYVEDSDLAYRLRLRGGRCVLATDAVIAHVGSATMGARSEFALYHGVRNRLWMIAKCTPWPILALMGPLHVGVLLVQIVKAPFHGPAVLKGTLRGVRDGVAGLARLGPARREAMASRTISLGTLARSLTWSPRKLLTRAPDLRTITPPND
ncbi:MAG: glycosyltransferase family 2 protein [Maricaulaceae bacterium]